ncbi:MAG: hypothetical protein IPL61_27035 [Myxococcales bacterium]|nr:hypothetical protein [Myxococcales bacterium]
MTADPLAPPDWQALEAELVTELRAAIDVIALGHGDEPLAAIVLWADPYKGWYEVHLDTAARNQAGAKARNAQMRALIPEVAGRPDSWQTAKTVAARTEARTFDPRYGEYTSCDEAVHEFTISYDPFLRSPQYEALNQGGEDGWLEGHVRFAIARAILHLVEAGAFAAVNRGPALHLGYAYPDSGDAIIVALITDDDAA